MRSLRIVSLAAFIAFAFCLTTTAQTTTKPDAIKTPEAVDVEPLPPASPSGITPPQPLGNKSISPACKAPGLHSQIVNLSFNVTTEGRATDIKIKDKVSDELAQCAIQTVQATHFTPAMQNGRPVVVRIELALNLEIK